VCLRVSGAVAPSATASIAVSPTGISREMNIYKDGIETPSFF